MDRAQNICSREYHVDGDGDAPPESLLLARLPALARHARWQQNKDNLASLLSMEVRRKAPVVAGARVG